MVKRLVRMGFVESLEGRRILLFKLGNLVKDQIGLRFVHRGHHQALVSTFAHMTIDGLCNDLGLSPVEALAVARLVDRLRMMMKDNADLTPVYVRVSARENDQPV